MIVTGPSSRGGWLKSVRSMSVAVRADLLVDASRTIRAGGYADAWVSSFASLEALLSDPS
jgi:hypothetical protein